MELFSLGNIDAWLNKSDDFYATITITKENDMHILKCFCYNNGWVDDFSILLYSQAILTIACKLIKYLTAYQKD